MDGEKVPLNETASEADFFPPELGQCEMCKEQKTIKDASSEELLHELLQRTVLEHGLVSAEYSEDTQCAVVTIGTGHTADIVLTESDKNALEYLVTGAAEKTEKIYEKVDE